MPGTLLALVDPATTDAATTTGSALGWVGTALQLLWVLFLFALVLFLAYVTTRVVGRRFGGAGSGRYLRTIDSVPLGQNRSVALIEVSGEVYCVGVTEHGMTLLGKMERGALIELEPRSDTQMAANPVGGVLAGFGDAAQDVFGRITGHFQRPARDLPNARATDEPAADVTATDGGEFADRIREQIERLRKIGEQDKP